MLLRQIFDPYLAQYAYLVGCQKTGEALVIDPLRDIDQYRDLAEANELRIVAVAETHIHADFVSGGREFAEDPDISLYLSAEGGEDWSYRWPGDRPRTHYLRDGDEFRVGGIRIRAVHTPGHTPEHLSFLITDEGGGATEPIALATGDFLFVGDVGRPDLLESAAGAKGVMEPSARKLKESLRGKLPDLPEFLQILPGHGAGSACGKSLGAVPTTTMGYERRFNRPLRQAMEEGDQFVKEILAGQPEPPLYFARMKRVNKDGIEVTGRVPEVPRLSARKVETVRGVMPELVPVDARQDAVAFAQSHLPGSLHAPLRSSFFTAATGSLVDEESPILLVLEEESDLDLAVRQLYRIGYDRLVGWVLYRELESAGLATGRIERLEFEQFDPVMARASGVILDVRTSKEFAEGHLDGALSLPYTRLRARIDEVPAGQRLYLHCGSGRRAGLAASFLASLGHEVVHVDGLCEECERIAQQEGVAH